MPLVELSTVHGLDFVSDNGGVIAIDDSDTDLLGRDVFFTIRSHDYDFPEDGFGFAGKKLEVEHGRQATLTIERRNIAERLYRITGAGRWQHARRVG